MLILSTVNGASLELGDAVSKALENNFDVRLNRFDYAQSEANIERAEASFDPTLRTSLGYNERKSPGSQTDQSGNSSPSRESVDGDFSISKRTGLGTQITLSTDAAYSSFSDDTQATLGFNIRQPLLGGAGKTVNLANLFRARVRNESALLSYRGQVLDTIQETVDAYWSLAFEQERLRLLQSSLELAENLLSENERRLELGLATDLEVLQAQASLATRQQALLDTELSIEAAHDKLWVLLGLEILADYSDDVVPLPDATPVLPDEAIWFPEVMAHDLDLRIIENSLAILERDRAVARRNLLPRVDLSLNGRALGRESDTFGAYDSAIERSGYSWGAGISVSMPWGRREDKADERLANLELRKETTRLERAEYNKRVLARQVIRDLKASLAQLEISEKQVALQEKLFERERAGYRAGVETFRNVLQAQRSLDDARLQRVSTLQRVLRQDTLRARLDHELFQRFNISWDTAPRVSLVEKTEEDGPLDGQPSETSRL
ncbi:MAG: TolC family protein [Opitutales bacterium]